jgi:hypothetical protein
MFLVHLCLRDSELTQLRNSFSTLQSAHEHAQQSLVLEKRKNKEIKAQLENLKNSLVSMVIDCPPFSFPFSSPSVSLLSLLL